MPDKSISERFLELLDQAKTYVDLQIRYFKLTLGERLFWFISTILVRIILFWTILLTFIFGSLAFVYWFGERTGNLPGGFLIAGGFYLLCGILLLVFRNPLIIDPLVRIYYRLMELDENEKEGEKDE